MKKILSILLILAMVFCMFACGDKKEEGKEEGGDETVYTFAMARNIPASDPACQADQVFIKLVEEKSNGRIKVNWYGDSTVVANDNETLEKVADGTIQLGSTTASIYAAYANMDDFNVLNEPMMYNSIEEVAKVAESDWYKDLCKKFEEKTGVIITDCYYSMGWFGFGMKKADLTDIKNVKGFKVRAGNAPQQIGFIEGLGGAAVAINWNEIYPALQQGTVDGVLTSASLAYNYNFHEQFFCYKDVKAFPLYHAICINAKAFYAMPEDLQKIMLDCLTEARATYLKNEDDALADCIQNMEAYGVLVPEVTAKEQEMMVELSKAIWADPAKAACSNETINIALDILGKSDLKV